MMALTIALTALAALGLPGGPFHESFHADGRQRFMAVTECSDRNQAQRCRNPTTWPEQLSAVLIRADSGGGTYEFLNWLTTRSRQLQYSVRMVIADAIGKVPADAWTPAYDGDGEIRDGAWVADITGLLDTGG